MKSIIASDIFTCKDIKKARQLDNVNKIKTEIIDPKMDHINKVTMQKNDPKYFAYLLYYLATK